VSHPDDADDALDPGIDRTDPNDSGAAIARAVDPQAIRIDLRLQAEEGEGCLHVGHPSVGRQAAARALACAPTLVVEGEHDVAGFVEDPGVVGQVEILDAGVAVAQHDARAPICGAHTLRQVEIAG
jgi:hypothetical protein